MNRTELIKCNNIWSYIRYRVPPSVVALKVSYGSVINFFLKFWKILKNLKILKNSKFLKNSKSAWWNLFEFFKKINFQKFLHFSKNLKNFEFFKNFENFKKVDYLWALSWQNATTSEVIFVIESLLQWLHLS